MKTWTTRNGHTITQVLSGRCNCFLVRRGNARLLVDTGRTAAWGRLRTALASAGVVPGQNLDVVLTHTHFDHAENVASLKETFQVTLLAHRLEAPLLASGAGPIPAGSVFLTRALMAAAGDRARNWFRYRPATVDIPVDGPTNLEDRGLGVRLVHTPGHTAGSISVIVDDDVALVGDAMVGVMPGAIFPPFGEDRARIVSSWAVLLETDCRLFLPAHGGACTRRTVERQHARYRGRFD